MMRAIYLGVVQALPEIDSSLTSNHLSQLSLSKSLIHKVLKLTLLITFSSLSFFNISRAEILGHFKNKNYSIEAF